MYEASEQRLSTLGTVILWAEEELLEPIFETFRPPTTGLMTALLHGVRVRYMP